MKVKTKKILIVSGISTVVAGLVATGFGVYFSTPSLSRISTKGIYTIRQNVKLNEYGYKYDFSATYGSSTNNSLSVIVSNNLLSLKSEGQLILDKNNETLRPSYQSYKFELADSVVLFLENANDPTDKFELSFNSDAADFPRQFGKTDVVVNKVSNDPNSINNPDIFLKLLSHGSLDTKVSSVNEIKTADIKLDGKYVIKNFGFTIREGVKWVNSKGEETKYDICANDFYYSFMRTKLFDTAYRTKNGGSSELDAYFISKTNATSRFLEKDRYPNGYLYDFFDVDINALTKRETAIKKTSDNRDAFVFTIQPNVQRTTGFYGILNKFVVNSIELSAAPSQYIDELAKDNSLNNINSKLVIKDEARNFGIYTYGQTRTSTLYASKYIPKSAQEQREIYEYNKHYSDSKWVETVEKGEKGVPIISNNQIDYDNFENVKAINKIIFEYTNGVDSATFNSQLMNSYLNGVVSEIQYSDLTPTQKQMIYGNNSHSIEDIRDNAIKNGLQFSKKMNISSLVQRTIVQSNPAPNGLGKYTFNDNYSKLVYGNSLNELNSGKAVTTESFYSGLGMEFRTLVQAAINWDTYISQAYTGQRVMWLSSAAENAKFSSFNELSKTPLDYSSEVNTLLFFDRKTNKFVSITPDEMKKQSQNPIQEEQIKSPKFNQIKENMKLVLDEFYKKNNLNSSEKINWKVVYPYWNQDAIKITIMEYVVRTINALDSRLNAVLVVPKTREEALDLINKNYGVSDFNGWGYDYEGIGSYFAAFINGAGVNIVNAIGLFSQEDSLSNERIKMLKTQLPEFTKFSNFVKKRMNEELSKANINGENYKKLCVENWINLNNQANQDLRVYYAQYVNNFDPTSVLSKIFKEYEAQTVKDEEWAQLIKEFNVIKGISTDSDNSILDPYSASLALYLKEYVIPTTKYGIQYFGDYRYVSPKK